MIDIKFVYSWILAPAPIIDSKHQLLARDSGATQGFRNSDLNFESTWLTGTWPSFVRSMIFASCGHILALSSSALLSYINVFIAPTPSRGMSTTWWSRLSKQQQDDQDDRASELQLGEKDQGIQKSPNDNADLSPGELTFEEGAVARYSFNLLV